jgi:hypothetical protein
MAGLVDAVLARPGANTRSYIFAGDQYIEYEWAAPIAREDHNDYALDGVHSIAEWGFPPAFAGEGTGNGVDAALAGRGAFDSYGYIFRGTHYVRYRWLPPGFDPETISSIEAWRLPTSLGRIDAAYNGALNRSAYCYFAQSDHYYRYVWSTGLIDAGYPKKIGTLVGMPPDFASGFDSVCDGMGPYADRAYFFKGDNYLRFQWTAGSEEPHLDGTSSPVQGSWLGLAELLAAARAKTEALAWLAAAMPMVHDYANGLASGGAMPSQALVEGALSTHFHLNPATPSGSRLPSVNYILVRLHQVEATLRASATTFRFRTDTEASADGSTAIDAAYTWPWPPSPATRINVTRNFLTRSARNRVASLLHEAVHVNDPDSIWPNRKVPDPIHIPEWYVNAPEALRLGIAFVADRTDFERRYDQMTTANALHNPAAYATFARHLHFRFDDRQL